MYSTSSWILFQLDVQTNNHFEWSSIRSTPFEPSATTNTVLLQPNHTRPHPTRPDQTRLNHFTWQLHRRKFTRL